MLFDASLNEILVVYKYMTQWSSVLQVTYSLIVYNLCLEVLTVHDNKLRLFWTKAFLSTLTLFVMHDLAAVGNIFNVFSCDTVWGRNSSPQTFWQQFFIYSYKNDTRTKGTGDCMQLSRNSSLYYFQNYLL